MTPEDWEQMKEDRKNCVGCLSQCQFSTWSAVSPTGSTGRIPDPRTYCIHKTLYEVGHGGSVKDHLLFAGHQVYRFATDPLYRNGCIPSVKELIEKSNAANKTSPPETPGGYFFAFSHLRLQRQKKRTSRFVRYVCSALMLSYPSGAP